MNKLIRAIMVIVALVVTSIPVYTVLAMEGSSSTDSSSTASESTTTKSSDASEIAKKKAELAKKQAELVAEAAKKQAELKVEAAKRSAVVEKKRVEASTEAAKKNIEVEAEAVTNSAELDKKRIEIESEFQKKKAELELSKMEKVADAAARCDVIESRVATITTRHENNKSRNVIAYENMYTRLTKVASRFEAKGLDVSTLTADLAILNNKIIKLKTDHATYLTSLLDSKQYACGKSEGEFKSTLTQARAKMAIVKTDIQDIKNFYQTTIKTDVTALKLLVEKTEKTSSEATSRTTSTGTATVPTITP